MQSSPVKTVYHPFMITYPQVAESHNAIVRWQQPTAQHWRMFFTLERVKCCKLFYPTSDTIKIPNGRWQN
jgi:hypothetical protein